MNRSRIVNATIVSIIPVSIILSAFIITPGYLLPFFHHPAGIGFGILLGIGMAIGFGLMLLSDKIWPRVVIGILLSSTTALLVMLGPALVTIVQALGPVMQDESKDGSGSSGAGTSTGATSDNGSATSGETKEAGDTK